MLYFIPWALLMLVCILAVPIAAMMEKRRARAAFDGVESGEEEMADDESEADAEPAADEEAVEVEAAEPEETLDAVAADDFSAFEEEFK